jgi:soluble lytic murein transglycosylase-like protein
MITAADQVRPWALRIKKAADQRGIDPYLLGGLVATESGGRQYAQRVERGFWSRYSDGILRWVKSTTSVGDDMWAKYPDIYASSYGLCQIMLQTAAEHGFTYEFPGELFDPDKNLATACVILSSIRTKVDSDRTMLDRYNGGADPAYPDRVFRNRAAIMATGILS